ncbi:hypothetical protein COCSADRAFT_22990 [Bipolaris sorokiniana ND90Pr]|uniref:Uncharacterized protein n=1 Tax=Cochliobolus sativus (strain ND90Pr / ATCC 201652) TaxID=665912 RepID=M2RPP0_COCSN|nr:uncharacterized protein COCSADRAFT_22990 [Bipolaris sorokiniana ND90Pr]EMD68554.1 hypothetical protein COCSADRAFT_22990 [Bipolaris sorokiniana ND90Pr]
MAGHRSCRQLNKSTSLESKSKDYDQEQLLVAAKYGDEEIVKLLLRKDEADVNFKDMNGRTPLLWAAFGGHLTIFECLLQKKADVNATAAGDRLSIFEEVFQAKADVNIAAVRYSGGRTALQAAAERGHLAVFEGLLKRRLVLMQQQQQNVVEQHCR